MGRILSCCVPAACHSLFTLPSDPHMWTGERTRAQTHLHGKGKSRKGAEAAERWRNKHQSQRKQSNKYMIIHGGEGGGGDGQQTQKTVQRRNKQIKLKRYRPQVSRINRKEILNTAAANLHRDMKTSWRRAGEEGSDTVSW